MTGTQPSKTKPPTEWKCPYCKHDKEQADLHARLGTPENFKDMMLAMRNSTPEFNADVAGTGITDKTIADNVKQYIYHQKNPDIVHNSKTGKWRGHGQKDIHDAGNTQAENKSAKSCPFCKDFAALTADHPMKIDNLVNLQDMHDRNPEAFHKKLDGYIKNIEKATMAISSPKTGETCNCETGDHSNAGGQEHGMFNQDIGRQTWQGQGLPQPKQDKENCQCDEKPAESNKAPNADARLGDDEDEKKKSYCQCNKVYDAEGKELKVVNPLHGARPTGVPKHDAADIDEMHGEHFGEIPRSNVGGRHNAPPHKQSKGDKWMSRHMTPEALHQHERTTYDPDLAVKLTGKSLFDKIYDSITKKNPRTNWQERSDMNTAENTPYGKRDIPASRVGNRGDEKIGNNIQNDTSSTLEDRINLKLRRGERLPKGGKLKPNFASFDPNLAEKLTANKADDDEQITGTSTGAKTTKNPKKYLHKPSEHNPMGVINPQWTDWRAARRKQLKEGKRETNSKKLLENMGADTKLNLQTQAKLISAGTQDINDQKRAEQNKKRKKMTKQRLAARRKRLLGKAILKIKAMLERLKYDENAPNPNRDVIGAKDDDDYKRRAQGLGGKGGCRGVGCDQKATKRIMARVHDHLSGGEMSDKEHTEIIRLCPDCFKKAKKWHKDQKKRGNIGNANRMNFGKTELGDGTWGMRGLGEGEGTTDIQGGGDTYLISPVKQKDLDKLMAGARYMPRSVKRRKD